MDKKIITSIINAKEDSIIIDWLDKVVRFFDNNCWNEVKAIQEKVVKYMKSKDENLRKEIDMEIYEVVWNYCLTDVDVSFFKDTIMEKIQIPTTNILLNYFYRYNWKELQKKLEEEYYG